MSTRIIGLLFQGDHTTTEPEGSPLHILSMFDFRTGEGDEFRAIDSTQGFPFLNRNAVSSLGNLVCTLLGNRYDAVNVSAQYITHTDAHPGDGHPISDTHTDGLAEGDNQSGAEVLEAATCTHFRPIAQAA